MTSSVPLSSRQGENTAPLTVMQKLEKVVPDQPKNSTPVHLRTRQVLADFPLVTTQKPFVAPKADGKEASS